MGLIQNKVTVSQPNSHVVVKNAGGLRGLTGETGPQGPQGVPGEAATVTAGTTTTLPAGSDATVQNVGSTSAAIFNFGIPKGDKGDTGETGAAATISVGTTTTLEPGEDATVTNSGTSSAAVFDFGIPKGAKGDTGSQGPAGQDGFSPTATVTKTGDTATITITDKDGTTTAQISDGVTPTIDPALSPTSENPVQNKVVTNALAGKADKPIVVSSLPATGTAGQEYFVDDRYNTVTELKGDTQQTTYSGKNLASPEPLGYADMGITATYNAQTGEITLSGTATGGYSIPFRRVNQAIPAGTYTIKQYGNLSHGRMGINFRRADGTQITEYVVNTGTLVNTFTLSEPAAKTYLFTLYHSAGQTVEGTVKFQMEAGSTATSFEPYVGGTASPNPDYPQEVQTVTGEQTITISDGQGNEQEYKVGLTSKNLLNPATFVKGRIDSGVVGYASDTSALSNTENTITFTTTANYRGAASDFVVVDAETQYRLQQQLQSGISNYIDFYDTSKTWISRATSNPFTTPQDCGYVRVSYQGNSAGTYTVTNPQLEKGSAANTYTPYFTPIELCKIGTYQDYIYKSGEDWYVHKEIGKYTLDGSLAWYESGSCFKLTNLNTDLGYAPMNAGYVFYPATDSIGLWCNYGIAKSGYKVFQGTEKGVGLGVGGTGGGGADGIYVTGGSLTLANFQTILNASPLVCDYILETATDTQITNADLIAQLEALAGAKIMVDGGTATVTSQYLPATLTTAYNSNSGYIDYIYDGTNFVKVR